MRTGNRSLSRGLLLLTILMTISTCITGFSQSWYFGQNAGLNFAAAIPTAIPGPINTAEGSSIVYDNTGQVLFSTDGSVVYDRNNNPLPNGTGLMGNASATQSALIVPIPNTNCEKYFVFTIDAAENSLANGFRYSLIDKSLNSGLGDVVASQKNLIPPTMNNIRVAEKLTAVVNSTGDVWVVVHGFEDSTNNNPAATSPGYRFYAFKISNATMPSPVVSNIGSLHNMNNIANQYRNSQGQMKISHDGTKIALAVHLSKFVEIYDFSTTTGVVSGPPHRINFPNRNECQIYGIEFSSNNNYLYVSTTYDFPNQARVYQFDISPAYFSTFLPGAIMTRTYATAPINDPPFVRQVSPNNYACQFGALQLGPDNNVYVASMLGNGPNSCNNSIDMISGANLPTATFNQNYVLLSPGLCRRGLPTVIQGNYSCEQDTICCPGDNLVSNGDFENGNIGFTSGYSYQTPFYNSVMPGMYSILNSSDANTVSPITWDIDDHTSACTSPAGKFMVVNGATGQLSGPRLVWEQNVGVLPNKDYRFCAWFRDLKQCEFNVLPNVEIRLTLPAASPIFINKIVNTLSNPCDWQLVSHAINTGSASTLNIQIWLDEGPDGDGNDLAIDDINLKQMSQFAPGAAQFNVATTWSNATSYSIMATPNSTLFPPAGADGCGYFWEVCEVDNTGNCLPGTMVTNPSQWWTGGATSFPGYNGTSTLTTTPSGIFQIGRRYKIRYGIWCDCYSWTQSVFIIEYNVRAQRLEVKAVADDTTDTESHR